MQSSTAAEPLTPREQEIALLVMHGLSNKQIARKLDLREGRVKLHVRTIMQKFEAGNRTQIALRYYEIDRKRAVEPPPSD